MSADEHARDEELKLRLELRKFLDGLDAPWQRDRLRQLVREWGEAMYQVGTCLRRLSVDEDGERRLYGDPEE